jgi:hypothetical protein
LLEPLSKPATEFTAENASVYALAIAPILDKNCNSWHNENKAKGKLIMTDSIKFKLGGKQGVAFEAGHPENSLMIQTLHLPLDHKEHMPPKGKPQLSPTEISLLEQWIKAGADFNIKLHELPPDDALHGLVRDVYDIKPNTVTERSDDFEAASETVIAKVNTPFVTVTSLHQNSPALQANFYIPQSYDVKSLEQLKTIEKQLVVLNLSRMPLEDKALSIIAGFKNLEVLNLNFTPISAAALTALEPLKNLRQLSVAGTSITATSLQPMLQLPNLREVYAWNTNITLKEKDSLAVLYPKVDIQITSFNDAEFFKLSKPMLVNEGPFTPAEPVELKYILSGVKIYVSLDGSVPDTIKGGLYERPFYFKATTTVKAIACKDGWYCSDLLEVTCVVKAGVPDDVSKNDE